MKYTQKLAAALTAGMLAGSSDAFAAGGGTNFQDVSNNIMASSQDFPNLISTVSYIGGIGLGVAGIFKLKEHVDNPGQAKMKDGLVRLGAGGGLLALPFITDAMTGTIGTGATGPNPSDLAFSAATFGTP